MYVINKMAIKFSHSPGAMFINIKFPNYSIKKNENIKILHKLSNNVLVSAPATPRNLCLVLLFTSITLHTLKITSQNTYRTCIDALFYFYYYYLSILKDCLLIIEKSMQFYDREHNSHEQL